MLKSFETLVHRDHSTSDDIEILLLMALAYHRKSDQGQSITYLKKAFEVYSIQRNTRPFRELVIVAPYLFQQVEDIPISLQPIIPSQAKPTKAPQVLHQHKSNGATELTSRELEIFKLPTAGLRNKEIANQLNISTAAVKSHLTHIFQKLDVHNRTSMIQRMQDSEQKNS